ncbi:MAG: hypothetical protein WDO19_24675 [Bacteroidota bacterium]
MKGVCSIILLFSCIIYPCGIIFSQVKSDKLDIPDSLIMEAYKKAAEQNVLAAVNPKIFYGYFSVCADGLGFGYGNTYPSLDGHQMSDALLWLGEVDVVKANWDYVKTFQKSKGELPIAIIPAEAGKNIGPAGFQSPLIPMADSTGIGYPEIRCGPLPVQRLFRMRMLFSVLHMTWHGWRRNFLP